MAVLVERIAAAMFRFQLRNKSKAPVEEAEPSVQNSGVAAGPLDIAARLRERPLAGLNIHFEESNPLVDLYDA